MTVVSFHSKVIRDIAEEMRPGIYVGLGICGGETFRAVVPYAKVLYACDINPGCIKSTEPDNPKTNFYGMNTDDFADVWKTKINIPIDLIFVDACHQKENVLRDVQNFYPYLKVDTGIMVLHDTWPPDNTRYTQPNYCGDGYLAKKEISKLPDIEMLTVPCQYGITLIRKVGDNWRNGA